jgi:aryl-alcohol dehydrogenase-like predicted oxidoreductase
MIDRFLNAPVQFECSNRRTLRRRRPRDTLQRRCEIIGRQRQVEDANDFKMRVQLGRTGRMVSRLGLASGYGVPTAAIEKAFHEHGVNYFYLSLLKRGQMVQAIRNLAAHRDELFIVLARPTTYFLERLVERWLRSLGVGQIDAVLLQDHRRPPPRKLIDAVRRLRESGKVRFVGMSSHDRSLVARLAGGELQAPMDFFQLRYNAVHPGAEKDVFPHLPREGRPGVVVFTATCWGKLLQPRLMPEGERPLQPADCYRFVLSRPDVDVCITGPSTARQMEENLAALSAGPLADEEMARIRRIGRHLHGSGKASFWAVSCGALAIEPRFGR